MKHRAQHLREERLFECYLTVRNGERLDPPLAEHLADCDECGTRYAELTQFMEALDLEATVEADEIFTPERLRAQQEQIARRLEHLGHPARVISFPARAARRAATLSAPRSTRRVVAAAAAAGLFVGVATGLFLDWDASRGTPNRERAVVRGGDPAPPGRVQTSLSDADEAFLSELQLAGERPRIRELRAIDALTPHVREVTFR